jgi:lipopolysaccharide biosynthesis protein
VVRQSPHDVENCRAEVPVDQFRLDFFSGTMFWVRPEALKPLARLRLSGDMPYESGLIDGDLPHAIERVLSTSVLVAGFARQQQRS